MASTPEADGGDRRLVGMDSELGFAATGLTRDGP